MNMFFKTPQHIAIAIVGFASIFVAAPSVAQTTNFGGWQAANQPAPVNQTAWGMVDMNLRGGAAGIGQGATSGTGTIVDRVAGGDSTSTWNGFGSVTINTCGGTCADNNVRLGGTGTNHSVGYSGIHVQGPDAGHARADSMASGAITTQGLGVYRSGAGTPPTSPIPTSPH